MSEIIIHTGDVHKKGWGFESWIHNDEKYCGKLLSFCQGKKMSLHYHKKKTETFFVQKGKGVLICANEDGKVVKWHNIVEGMCVEVPTLQAHAIVALTDMDIFEFSTQHFEDDSYRILKGD